MDNVIKDLFTDQFYGYKIVSAIRSGNIPKDLALLKIGPVNHSRWLTTANRLCRIWVSKHELEGFKKSFRVNFGVCCWSLHVYVV